MLFFTNRQSSNRLAENFVMIFILFSLRKIQKSTFGYTLSSHISALSLLSCHQSQRLMTAPASTRMKHNRTVGEQNANYPSASPRLDSFTTLSRSVSCWQHVLMNPLWLAFIPSAYQSLPVIIMPPMASSPVSVRPLSYRFVFFTVIPCLSPLRLHADREVPHVVMVGAHVSNAFYMVKVPARLLIWMHVQP